MGVLVLALGGCVQTDSPAPGPGPSSIAVEPIGIYFGDLPWDELGVVPLTLRNVGDETHAVDLVPSSNTVMLESSGMTLGPGETVSVGVGWGNDGSLEPIDTAIEVRSDGVATAVVPVMGERTYPRLRTSRDQYVLDDVAVGCNGDAEVTLRNRGTGDALVSSVELLGGDEFVLGDLSGNPIDVPFTLVAGGSAWFRVSYAPNGAHESTTAIRVTSASPTSPFLDVAVVATGVLESTDTVSLSWVVAPPADAVTALFEINAEVVAYLEPLTDAFEAFFTALGETGIPFRVAIARASATPYIDDTFDTYEAVAATRSILLGLSGDEDASLEHLLTAIEWNDGWLLDPADPGWDASRLHLVVINVDAEQSPRDAAYYVEEYQAYKDDLSMVVVHGIAGPTPAGCSGGPGASSANPSENLVAAVDLTGGTFRSICEDWTANLESLVLAMHSTIFRLEGVPSVPTIDVAVDGVEVSSGWSYEPTTNEIVFDDPSYPPVGSEVVVEYLPAMVCK